MQVRPDDSRFAIRKLGQPNRAATVVARLASGFRRTTLKKGKINIVELILTNEQPIASAIDESLKAFGRDAPNQFRSHVTRYFERVVGLRYPFRLKNSSFQTVRNSG